MERLRFIGFMVGVFLLVLSLAAIYVGWTEYADVRDAGEYEDRGVISFAPHRVLPEQVKNTSGSSQDRRMNPTRTAYMVYYRATDGSGYQWKEEAASKSIGQDIVSAGVEVERRVLRLPAEGSYITLEPEQTAESYTEGLRQRYTLMVGVSAVYIAGYVLVLVVLRKHRENQ